jgi:hypothetical protein
VSWSRLPALLVALLPLLAACGDLPRPYAGRPGSTAMRLSQPPPARLAIAPPEGALLNDAAARAYAAAVAEAMQESALPAVAEAPRPGDWRLELTAELQGGMVVPSFRVRDPAGADKGTATAAPVPAGAWQAASPETLKAAGHQAAPSIATLLTAIEAARREADPNSLVNRPVRVELRPVTGAPGDGNTSLTRAMRAEIVKLGMVPLDSNVSADYAVVGDVETTDVGRGVERIEIRWRVTDARGNEAGQVTQLNEIPKGSLAGMWADVAIVVAQEAAGGVRDVIQNQTGRKAAPPPPPAAPRPTS